MLFNPNYISGLVQADGSFFVTISNNPKSKYGLRIRATFTITQNLDSIGILEQVQSYFKCGNVFINKKRGSESLEELLGFLGSEVFQIEIKEP